MSLSRAPAPFSHRDWIFEVKWDGFRALLHSDADGVRLFSRNGNRFKSFPELCEGLARDLNGRRCVLDGEIVCLDSQGKPQFRDLLFRRAEPVFYAFDLLWDEHAWSDDEEEMLRFRNGEDTRYLPLTDRKLRLRRVMPEDASWLKIRNPEYSQWVRREELFERERRSDPDFRIWAGCALARGRASNKKRRQKILLIWSIK